jgi:hypothetical protein
MIETLKYILGGFAGSFITWFLARWLPEHPEYGEKIFYYLLRLIPFTLSWKKRKTIEKEIHAYITEEIKSVNSKAYGFKILPKAIKIEWTPKKKAEVIIGEDEIVIRLGSRVNPCENFVDALLLYLANSFMPDERIYLEPTLYEACKFQIASSMLRERSSEHYQVFIDKYYKPALDKYKEILDYSEKLESIEKSGLFISCFLPISSYYADRWIFQRKSPSAEIYQEIEDLLTFVYNIAIKKEYEAEIGELPPLDYRGKYLKVSIVLVARKELADRFEYRRHLETAKAILKQGVDILFVMGRGWNIDLTEKVSLRLRSETFCEQIDGTCKFTFYPEEGRAIPGICYAFKRKA